MTELIKAIYYKLKCIDDSISNEFYIGYTTRTITDAMKNHLWRCNTPSSEDYNCPLYRYIRHHGGIQYWRPEIIDTKIVKSKYDLLAYNKKLIDLYKPELNTKQYTLKNLNSITKTDIINTITNHKFQNNSTDTTSDISSIKSELDNVIKSFKTTLTPIKKLPFYIYFNDLVKSQSYMLKKITELYNTNIEFKNLSNNYNFISIIRDIKHIKGTSYPSFEFLFKKLNGPYSKIYIAYINNNTIITFGIKQ